MKFYNDYGHKISVTIDHEPKKKQVVLDCGTIKNIRYNLDTFMAITTGLDALSGYDSTQINEQQIKVAQEWIAERL